MRETTVGSSLAELRINITLCRPGSGDRSKSRRPPRHGWSIDTSPLARVSTAALAVAGNLGLNRRSTCRGDRDRQEAIQELLCPGDGLRAFRPVSLWPDPDHRHLVFPGTGRRPGLSDERCLALLVSRSVPAAIDRRYLGLVRAFLQARPDRSGSDRGAVLPGWPRLSSPLQGRHAPVLHRGREPDHAVGDR